MCLLTFTFNNHPDAPLVVAANRDEWLDRPTRPFGVLGDCEPRVLGGRDEIARGTWLATNEHGVVAGLTNRPILAGRDDSKRSRGELPLVATSQSTAAAAATLLCDSVHPQQYNPCWLLIGDRQSLFYVDVTGHDTTVATAQSAGIHVLENRPLHSASQKAAQVSAALANVEATVEALTPVLANHEIPETSGERSDSWRPLETEAACVHAGSYGTRCSTIIIVPEVGLPIIHHAEGPPCTTRFYDVTPLWA